MREASAYADIYIYIYNRHEAVPAPYVSRDGVFLDDLPIFPLDRRHLLQINIFLCILYMVVTFPLRTLSLLVSFVFSCICIIRSLHFFRTHTLPLLEWARH